MMTAHRAGSRACSWLNFFAFAFFFCFFHSKNWASYQALSQQRCIEPATWHWAGNEGMVNLYCTGPTDFPMQPLQFQQIKLLINSGTMWDKIEDWQSIHIYVTPTVKLWSIWGNTSFLRETRTLELEGDWERQLSIYTSNYMIDYVHNDACVYSWDGLSLYLSVGILPIHGLGI